MANVVFELGERDIKEAIAAKIESESGVKFHVDDIKLSISPGSHDGPLYAPASVSATARRDPRVGSVTFKREDSH